jgi:hypothetical protein
MVDVSEKGRSGHGFSTERREERRRMRSEFPRWGNERADESHALSLFICIEAEDSLQSMFALACRWTNRVLASREERRPE